MSIECACCHAEIKNGLEAYAILRRYGDGKHVTCHNRTCASEYANENDARKLYVVPACDGTERIGGW